MLQDLAFLKDVDAYCGLTWLTKALENVQQILIKLIQKYAFPEKPCEAFL